MTSKEKKKNRDCLVNDVWPIREQRALLYTIILQVSPILDPQIREQMSGPDLNVFTLKFLALKNLVFPP